MWFPCYHEGHGFGVHGDKLSCHACGRNARASGQDTDAKGMAPAATIYSYGWESDLYEMSSIAANAPGQSTKIYVSNHSYGLLEPEGYFGAYMTDVDDLDGLVYGNEYYLPFVAAGNDQDLSVTGYDTIAYYGVAKNVMTVGAVEDAVSGEAREIANAAMTDFSSWGPVDDGRIKPDIVANGYELKSTSSASDTGYLQWGWSGTSMATPNASGSAALLVELYKELFSGGAMRASTLKGLIIHTADDLGNPGPDYKFGWGLMNTKAAADLIHDVALGNVLRMQEGTLSEANPSDTYSIYSTGAEALKVTLCWTDPAANENYDTLPDLVHDLDLRVKGANGTTYPYKLNRDIPENNASQGENNVDNVEQVYIEFPDAGSYAVTVDFDGLLPGESQNYSLLISGIPSDSDTDSIPDFWEMQYFGSTTGALASQDSDGDGADNLTEYISGFDPTDPASVFAITTQEAGPNGGAPFVITWDAVEGRIYNVKRSHDLLYDPFAENETLSGDLPYPADSFTDLVERVTSPVFYQVEVRLAD
ncbi:hypothetical protein EGM51_17990 [Verrucomicrobia bacterium S94]|nr:hypothetical protein EGM51_17990 [Verrucomicrobia bacterium S94]